jgi:thiamine biosynthesis lipoprotein
MPLHRYRFTVMGGPAEVQVEAPDGDTAAKWLAAARTEAERIEARFSRYRSDSWVGRLNAQAGGAALPADDEAMQWLAVADALHRDSGGRFDATSGALREAWRGVFDRDAAAPDAPIASLAPKAPEGPNAANAGDARPSADSRHAAPPDADTLRAALARVGWSRVAWRGREVRLPQPGMALDFGGFGKEIAVDRLVDVLRAGGAAHALVNLAGDCRALGPRPDGQPWQVGIAHPRAPGQMLATLPLQDAAVATSGDYERCFWHDGRRYGHVLDARTGWPVAFWASVSVLAPTALQAGNAATLALLAEGDALPALRASGLDFLAVEAASGAVHHR